MTTNLHKAAPLAELRARLVSVQSDLAEDAEAGVRTSAGGIVVVVKVIQWLDELIPGGIDNPVDFTEYQKQAHGFSLNAAVGNDTLVYPVLGLTNEAGEVAGKLKKIYRDSAGQITDAQRDGLKGELGDVLWYLAEICSQLNLTLCEVAEYNLAKLASRQARGAIQGNGDNR